MRRHRLTHKASSAPPSQTPLEGGADDAAPLTPNTVALPDGERRRQKATERESHKMRADPTPNPLGRG
jgi:hypothetical protein